MTFTDLVSRPKPVAASVASLLRILGDGRPTLSDSQRTGESPEVEISLQKDFIVGISCERKETKWGSEKNCPNLPCHLLEH